MQYRSVLDLQMALASQHHRLPADIDLVVGIPRSGLLAANLLCLHLNTPLTDLDSYLEGRIYGTGFTKPDCQLSDGKKLNVLILDDSISSGRSMAEARDQVLRSRPDDNHIFAAVYGLWPDHKPCDFVFEELPLPRLFQWNWMHHKCLKDACLDIDGVLCHDPTREQNDDSHGYVEFLENAAPLFLPSRKVKALVTSRLEKYRPQTEAWLRKNGVEYENLIMLDLPSHEERRKRQVHGQFKAEYYGSSDATLFVESELRQAQVIQRVTQKPVLCTQTQTLVDGAAVGSMPANGRNTAYVPSFAKRLKRKAIAMLK
ncbi:MAG: phosphoribosyltransferase family protein [Pseudomonadota bacterium]